MEANASTLISFIYLAMALLILWLAYVVVRFWLEARSEFLRRYGQQRSLRQPSTSADQSAQAEAPCYGDYSSEHE
jgi:HAMP domain-containing protein